MSSLILWLTRFLLLNLSFDQISSAHFSRKLNRGEQQSLRRVESKQNITEIEVRELFQIWNDALLTLDSSVVTKRYAKNAVLLPTLSDIPRNTPALIKDYFDSFLEHKPSGVILQGAVRTGTNWAEDDGIYEFKLQASGTNVRARYTFVYIFEDNEWKISHHHSSQMPEGTVVQVGVSESDVRSLFYLWNSAIESLDISRVLARYATNAVLLPTLSDIPRSTPELIEQYFDGFLKNQPTGIPLESYVYIGANYVMDVGIYQFLFRASGKVVKARYSFVYTLENGLWKIKHHHSSLMPEEVLKPAVEIKPKGIRSLYRRWNSALATLDEKNVTALYDDNAVVVASDEDGYFYSHKEIGDYYRRYLLKQPQCTVIHGGIMIGYNWAQDAGICNCTNTNGSTDADRFTMVYKYENDDWKIVHSHFSFLPEAKLAQDSPKL